MTIFCTMMNSVVSLLCIAILFPSTVVVSNHEKSSEVYVVYMGSSTSETKKSHDMLTNSLVQRYGDVVLRSYEYGFVGFAARLSQSEAAELATHPGVVSVFQDPVLKLQTTRSWDFLDELSLNSDPGVRPNSAALSTGSDIIIGVFDSGIWPESESFSDQSMDPIPSKWKGVCMVGPDFHSSNCNRKIIGARYYAKFLPKVVSPRDSAGHGTHVASTAAGVPVHNASFYGVAAGTARGGAPESRIAVYKVCDLFLCSGAAVLSAFDDAIRDGVDLVSMSIASTDGTKFLEDPLAIGSLHAVLKGIPVISAAGNSGPDPYTVVNVAPWLITVGATSIDRLFESKVILGNNKIIKGKGISFSHLKRFPVYKLVDGTQAKSRSVCGPSSVHWKKKVEGSIVLCHYDNAYDQQKLQSAKGVGAILIYDENDILAPYSGPFPLSEITPKEGLEISRYIKSSRNPVATIIATTTVLYHKPAPKVIDLSARGPAYGLQNLIKAFKSYCLILPDIGKGMTQLSRFRETGTSMACPHVSGIVAIIKSTRPTWSPAVIKSALMTTAIQYDNLKEQISTDSGERATPYDYGAGLVNQKRALEPGLVYEMESREYFEFLCYMGYNVSTIRLIVGQVSKRFSCPENSRAERISEINYPSIAVSRTNGEPVTVKRTVTNMDRDDHPVVYTLSSVESPQGLNVNVVPNRLAFTKGIKKLSYEVTFSTSPPFVNKGNMFGAVTWENGRHKVRTPISVSNLKT